MKILSILLITTAAVTLVMGGSIALNNGASAFVYGKNTPSSLRIYYVVNQAIHVGITAGGQTAHDTTAQENGDLQEGRTSTISSIGANLPAYAFFNLFFFSLL